MTILNDEQIRELIHKADKATKSFKLHPLYEYEKVLIEAAYRETLKMVKNELLLYCKPTGRIDGQSIQNILNKLEEAQK